MSAFSCRVLSIVLFAFVASTALAVDYGRTAGGFSVSATGAANYTIPIWTPPGPNGMTPSISLSYNSKGRSGDAGVGWNLAAVSAIERCNPTKHQDGAAAPLTLTLSDRFCMGGNRLRLGSGTYGVAGSVYFTEIADYSRITAYGVAGNGPQYFIVEAKSGLKYEYGATTSSRVFPGVAPTIATTPQRWMLNKVYDRSGNNYIISYNNLNGFAVPDTISWTPTTLGSPTYRYEAKFNYSTKAEVDSYIGKVVAYDVSNRYRIENVQIKSSGVVKRKYRFNYDVSTVTSRSRLTSAKECADDAESNCFLPITFNYQSGVVGITFGTGTPPAGSSNQIKKGRYDLNGDGKNDIVYWSGSSWYAAFGASNGFAGPYNTGVTGTALIDRFLPNGHDAIVTLIADKIWVYRWDDATSGFLAYNTGISNSFLGGPVAPTVAADYDGDGLADLATLTPNTVHVRRNISTGSTNPSFDTSQLTNNSQSWAGVLSYYGNGLQRADFNGDGRQDLAAVYVQPIYGPQGQFLGLQPWTTTLLGSNAGYSGSPEPPTAGGTPQWPSLNFNGDACTDRLIGSVVFIAKCQNSAASAINVPAMPLLLLDWDGDGKTDFLVDNGGTFGVYRSTGSGFLPLASTLVLSAGTYFAMDQDGDGLEDLVRVNGTSAISYWTHTSSGATPSAATNIPDLLSSVTDGFGVIHSVTYSSTAQSSYDRGAVTNYPLQEADPTIVVAKVTSSDGAGGTYNTTYYYVGARKNAERGEVVGFQRVDQTDSRNGLITRTYFEQSFPVSGMVSQREIMQPNGVTPISRIVHANTFATLDSTTSNQRYAPYTQGSTATRYEVGGSWNASLLSTVITANLFEPTSGTVYDSTVTTSEPVSGANGVAAGGSWVERNYTPLANLLLDTTNWCLGRSGKVQQINSHNLSYGTAITRTTDFSWDGPTCRPIQVVVEPGNSALQVTTAIGYDSFGNVNSTTVTGIGMAARTTTVAYSDGTFTTGQFPVSVHNALSQTSTNVWNYDLGVPSSSTDPNGISVSWQYDAFGRRIRENRPDGTYTTWDRYDACPSCDARVRSYIEKNVRDSGAVSFDRSLQYLDIFDRPSHTYVRGFDGTWSISKLDYDALGRVEKEYFPIPGSGSWVNHKSVAYDIANRPTAISRPISDTSSTLQTTTIYYEGLTTRVWDPQGKYTYKFMNSAGQLAQSKDHDGYYQSFDYDAFWAPRRVQDSTGNTLQSSDYNIRGMLTDRTDMDRGAWKYDVNALGEVVHIRDAKTAAPFWTQTLIYDELGRLKRRDEAEGTSTWTWGASIHNITDGTGTHKYIGGLKEVSGPGYSEVYTNDSIGRLQTNTVSADATYSIDYSYNSAGLVDSLTYPTSTSGYRLKLKYEYQNGYLVRLSDFNIPANSFWVGNAVNARGQYTQELFGNGLQTNSVYDNVTGRLKSIQTGVGGGTGVQNLAYEWDLVGNFKKRIDGNQSSLTEEFFYDNLYRLTSSQLNGAVNQYLTYDAMGNITYNIASGGDYAYHATKKHQVTSIASGSVPFTYDANGNMTNGMYRDYTWTSYNMPSLIDDGGLTSTFSYTPDRQYWKQVSNYTNGPATTIYVGGILEKVTTTAATEYRHMIRAGSATAIVSRSTSGTNTNYYVTSDHLGSSSAITNNSGGVLIQSSFAAFGQRRAANWSGANPSSADWTAIASTTRRGFTEHSMLDNLQLIHMNGRVYDPFVGRFVSADPFIPDPGSTQSYNRYSYVQNNPLTLIDPSGYEDVVPNSFCDTAPTRCVDLVSHSNTECTGACLMWQSSQRANGNIYATGVNAELIAAAEAYNLAMEAMGKKILDLLGQNTQIVDPYVVQARTDCSQKEGYCSTTPAYINPGITGLDLVKATPDVILLIATDGVSLIEQVGARAARGGLVIGRGADLAAPGALRAGEYALKWPSKLPNFKAEWAENAGRLREVMRQGNPIRDASVGNTGGMFLNAERALLTERGWTFHSPSGMWMPPGP